MAGQAPAGLGAPRDRRRQAAARRRAELETRSALTSARPSTVSRASLRDNRAG
ncbi:hypothetical protein NK6_1281 [Bradyrhizobium diazoefficiens]|uniref:Uncharacterized protein n=1 Tax=Bradyrhizobium diazoefficiens TaxID=1355477 RepID=A0A0E3VST4_9BRAD|nr:hypothetical protein NK6_1281 [Bradyrhizobium diazoefficiens]